MSFTPHLLPPFARHFRHDATPTSSADADEESLLKLYRDFYAAAPFVRVYDKGELPTCAACAARTTATSALKVDARTKRVIVISCTDNLGKGAAFQAIQNMNLMQGYAEAEGLEFSALTT